MKGLQFPIISNSATTGHKLQGSTVENIFANDMSYKKNWAYVVLSRVKELKGVHLKHRLKLDLELYKKPDEMKRMIQDLADNIECDFFTNEDYEQLLQDTEFAAVLNRNEYISSTNHQQENEPDESGFAY